MEKTGLILKGQNGLYFVRSPEGTVQCKASARLRHDMLRPMCGDNVIFTDNGDGTGYIIALMQRKNVLVRPRIANIDRLVIIVSVGEPQADLFTIDELTAVALLSDITPVLVFNKIDTAGCEKFCSIYHNTGFRIFCTDALSGEGTHELRDALRGCVSCFAGVSGVGKSSLMNALYPNIKAETGDLSEKIKRGKNTTRTTELFCVEDNTFIADSPGFGLFDAASFGLIKREALVCAFPEIEKYSLGCRYTKCTHTCEQGCRVIENVKNGAIPRSRHDSFVRLYKALNAKRY